jgi:membrane dipeptidase
MSIINPLPILDGHNDTLLELHLADPPNDYSFFVRNERGHIDLPRAREGGLGGGFFAIFTPAKPEPPDLTATDPSTTAALAPIPVELAYAQQFTLAMAARLFRLEAEANGEVKVVRTVNELLACLNQGVLAVIFHIEGAEAIDANLDMLYVLYQAGLRSLGIVWSRPNIFGYGVPFRFPGPPDSGPGLTQVGRDLVRESNRLGIMIDLSHLNEKGFWDVASLSTAPLVASHSGVHALCPSPRNLTDKQLDAIKESGGLVGVNFHVGFLRTDGQPNVDTPLTEIVKHINYMVERMGIEHVALGSDFDGARMPKELGDVAGLPKLMAALQESGYDQIALRKIAFENWVRVLEQTWR